MRRIALSTACPAPSRTPTGWDKTFCLQFLPTSTYPTIHFFGDKTHEGGGDYELYTHPRTIGHAVDSPEHTMAEVGRLLL